jgi:predicted RND superfamily exporter protein
MIGTILLIGYKINFLNFIAFPITFGIGVDYSVNIYQRYRQEKSVNIVRVIRNTGGAVGLCSLTTIIGYGSLLLAQSQAFVSFGVLAVLGEVTCMLVAIIALPAALVLKDRSMNQIPTEISQEKQESIESKAA